jgi:hypothetical protein
VGAHPLGQRLRQIATRTVVGEDLVATGPLDRRRQGPGPGDLDLEVPLVVLELLLEMVEILREQAARTPVVDPASPAGQPPADGLEVGAELRDDRQRPASHGRHSPAGGQLGKVRKVGYLTHHQAQGLDDVGARQRPDAGRERHAAARAVRVMVADPTTRLPS